MDNYLKEALHDFKKRKILRMRYVTYQIPSNISVCNNKMALISWGEKPTGVLIKSKTICESQIKFFENLWKEAKP